jgi:hypothetical protein
MIPKSGGLSGRDHAVKNRVREIAPSKRFIFDFYAVGGALAFADRFNALALRDASYARSSG